MKTLLILAYDFPPYVSVGGLRPYAWYQYLKDYGVYPIVVTRQWGNTYGNELDYVAAGDSSETLVEETDCGTIIRTPYKPNLANRLMLKYGTARFAIIRKAITAWFEFTQFLFFVGPKSGLYRGARFYLKRNHVDAIIATGEPFILFKYASSLSKQFGVPWIADYRDPWVQNKHRSRFMGRWNAFFERRFLAHASALTTVSEFFKARICENVSVAKTCIIPNGYNPDIVSSVSHISQGSETMSIAFAGTIYDWHPYKSVLAVIAEFARNKNVELHFFGINRPEEIARIVEKNHWTQYIHVYPRLRNNELLSRLCQHNCVLLFNDYSFIGTKIYDYLAIRRKILFCYRNDADAELLKEQHYPYVNTNTARYSCHLQEDCIRETQSGIVVENASHLHTVLTELYDEFLQKGCIACDSIHVDRYSRKYGAKQLAEFIAEIV